MKEVTITREVSFKIDGKEVLPPELQTLINRAAFYKNWAEKNDPEPMPENERKSLTGYFDRMGYNVDLDWFNSLHDDQKTEVYIGGACLDWDAVMKMREDYLANRVTVEKMTREDFERLKE